MRGRPSNCISNSVYRSGFYAYSQDFLRYVLPRGVRETSRGKCQLLENPENGNVLISEDSDIKRFTQRRFRGLGACGELVRGAHWTGASL